MKIYVGIDPGMHGAVGAVYSDGMVESFHAPASVVYKTTNSKLKSGKNKGQKKKRRTSTFTRDLVGRFALLHRYKKMQRAGCQVHVVLEHVSSMPHDGRKQAFSLGADFGQWQMALTALRLPYTLVKPSLWRPTMVGVGTNKAASLEKCRSLFPGVDLPLAKDEARAEAVLLAEWYRIYRTPSEPKIRKQK